MGGPSRGPDQAQIDYQTRQTLLGKLNSKDYASVLDPETLSELKVSLEKNAAINPTTLTPNGETQAAYRTADLAAIDKNLEDAKAGVGIYGVRRANYELANRLKNTPGSRQTILTNGQNSQSGVPSTGLMQNVGKK